MSATTFIYCLCEPGTRTIRYIGKTDGSLRVRLTRHISDTKKSVKDYHSNRWIRKLLKMGQTPDIHLLCQVPRIDFERFERAFIAIGRTCGLNLTNISDGGKGFSVPREKNPNLGRKDPPETRLKKSLAAKGVPKSPAHCKSMSLANTGKVIPPETRLKISAALSGEKNHNFGKPLHPNTATRLRDKRPGSSKFKGVHLHACGMWHAQFSLGYKKHYVGLFRKEIDAAVAHDTALERALGATAKLNFSYDPACYI